MTHEATSTARRGTGRSWSAPRLLLFVLLLAGGCALFAPRGSQSPDDGETIDWLPPLSPDAVLVNFAAVVAALEPHLYEELLADSGWTWPFRFVADPASAGQTPSWGLEEELTCWQRLSDQHLASQTLPTLFLQRTDSLLAGDSAYYTADYHLAFPAGQALEAADYAGTLRLSLSRNLSTGNWAIHRWEDWGADSLPSWTQLKQAFLWP